MTCDATGLIYRDRLNLHRQTWFKRLRHVDDGIRGVLSLEHLLEDTVDLIAVLCTALYIDHESGQLNPPSRDRPYASLLALMRPSVSRNWAGKPFVLGRTVLGHAASDEEHIIDPYRPGVMARYRCYIRVLLVLFSMNPLLPV